MAITTPLPWREHPCPRVGEGQGEGIEKELKQPSAGPERQ